MSDLLPCPWCGETPPEIVDATRILGVWRIVHRCKVLQNFAVEHSTRDRAIAIWNTRAPAPSPWQGIETADAAQSLMNWLDALADPFAVALAIAQAEEAYHRSLDMTGNEEAAKTARVRRFLESIAIGNAKLIRLLTPPPADGGDNG